MEVGVIRTLFLANGKFGRAGCKRDSRRKVIWAATARSVANCECLTIETDDTNQALVILLQLGYIAVINSRGFQDAKNTSGEARAMGCSRRELLRPCTFGFGNHRLQPDRGRSVRQRELE